jgi:hypothetical protein
MISSLRSRRLVRVGEDGVVEETPAQMADCLFVINTFTGSPIIQSCIVEIYI